MPLEPSASYSVVASRFDESHSGLARLERP